MPRRVLEEHPDERGAQGGGDAPAVVEKGDEPREAACIQGEVEHEEEQREQAQGDAYAAEAVHGHGYPVEKAPVRDDACGKAREEVVARASLPERKKQGNQGNVGEEKKGDRRLAQDEQDTREEGELQGFYGHKRRLRVTLQTPPFPTRRSAHVSHPLSELLSHASRFAPVRAPRPQGINAAPSRLRLSTRYTIVRNAKRAISLYARSPVT